MRSIIVFAIAALIIGALVPRLYVSEQAAPAARATAAPPAPAPEPHGGRTMTLRKADNGHFQTAAVVDGRRIEFLVDTGASVIALRESDAARLGIRPVPRDYTARASTASGRPWASWCRASKVTWPSRMIAARRAGAWMASAGESIALICSFRNSSRR